MNAPKIFRSYERYTMILIYQTIALALGLTLDALMGDPQGWPHIIRLLGAVISKLETWLYPMKNKRLGGGLLTAITVFLSACIPALLLFMAYRISPWLYVAAEALLVWQLMALKSLKVESKKVYTALAHEDLTGARYAVSMIVGRDTDSLTAEGVTKAAVETVAENASDGVIAPLLYIAIGGAGLGCIYKAINTLDSTVGYRNDRYLDFGRASAKLDDVVNFIPARLSAFLLLAAAALTGANGKQAAKIWRRDRHNHASPNSAQTESVMAGALEVQLAGDAYYFGKLHKKQTIGDDIRPIVPADILASHRLLNAAAGLLILITFMVRGLIYAAL